MQTASLQEKLSWMKATSAVNAKANEVAVPPVKPLFSEFLSVMARFELMSFLM